MKQNVHFMDTNGEEIVPIVEKSGETSWKYIGRNALTTVLLSSILLTGCWNKNDDSAQTAKLKAQTQKSKDLDKAKSKLAKEKEDVVEAEQEVQNAQEAYDESLSQ